MASTSKSNIISQDTYNQHVVQGYHFKVISEFDNANEENIAAQNLANTNLNQAAPIVHNNEPSENLNQNESFNANLNQTLNEEVPPPPPSHAFPPSFVEDLLNKTDEMSNNIIKLQMQMESQEAEFSNRLNTELENAKQTYTKEGYEKAKSEFDKDLEELKNHYLKSVSKLEEACVNLENFIAKNEKELADTAVDIAKEVILKEIDENSAKIAYTLAKDLLSELKGAANIEIKVSASDFEYLKDKFEKSEHIKVSLDDAITKGSVVLLSDAGNIESNLNNRLMKIKKMVNNE